LAIAFGYSEDHINFDYGQQSSTIALTLPNCTVVFEEMPGFSEEDIARGIELSAFASAIRQYVRLTSEQFSLDSLQAVVNPASIIALFIIDLFTLALFIFLSFKVCKGFAPIPLTSHVEPLPISPTGYQMKSLGKIQLTLPTSTTPVTPLSMTSDYTIHIPTMILGTLLHWLPSFRP
jgi:hypothetical protein